ncbi:MAG: alpha/beta hydrolase [Candidatus Margulisbacteria bacterium]|nr:alpha/beta hydrolase [Candidatus Margulisiibacteriota bacterium]
MVSRCRAAFQFIRSRCEKIYVVGFSLGGTLAYLLGSEYPDIAGIVTNGAMFKAAHRGANILRAIESVLERFNLDLGLHKIPVLDETKHFAYEIYPMRSTYQILEMADYTQPRLKNIKCPVMVIQASNDNVVHKKSVKIIDSNISSKQKEIIWFGEQHMSLVHPQKEIYQKILDFIQK